MLAKVAIAICAVTEANKETSMRRQRQNWLFWPPNHGRLATGEKRLFGREDVIVRANYNMPLVTLRDRGSAGRACCGRMDRGQ
jgi:hypothetical protein